LDGQLRDRLGVFIGDDIVIDDDLWPRVWDGRSGVQTRILLNRFERLVFRIDVPDWMSLE
jgi:hypothetical protein